METITISKTEHRKLLSRTKAYEKIAGSFFENAIKDPISDIVSDFKKPISIQLNFLKIGKMD